MFNQHRDMQHRVYNTARTHLIHHPNKLINLEKYITEEIESVLKSNLNEIEDEYNEASFLYPFWENYPPEERGRAPKGDQFPWIEVGEHTIGIKLGRLLSSIFEVKDYGLPTGADQRLVLRNKKINEILDMPNVAVWLFSDIKSAGPRDDADHSVMSHNQISGDGAWGTPNEGVTNKILTANGVRTSHPFHCSIPPLYVLSNGIVAPMVNVVVKPVYDMLGMKGKESGQPLQRITLATIPNGLLLTVNPNYLEKNPNLLFPGKDDKSKNPLKLRARVSFEILRKIAPWRVKNIYVN